MFALRFGELNLALSETINDGSRIILHRDVGDRLRTLAPFLHWEKRPEVVVVGGRIQFLAHGYTTSNSFPYSAPVDGRRQEDQLHAWRSGGHRGRLQRAGHAVSHGHRRSDPASLARRLPHPVHPRVAHAGCRTRPPALPARAVRRPVPGLGHLPHGQRRRLLHEGGFVAAAGRTVRTDPEGRLDPLSLQAREPADAPLLPARPPARRPPRAFHAHDGLHAAQPGEPERLPDRHDGPGTPAPHAADPAARAPGARSLPGQPADPRHPGSKRQAAAAQPGDGGPRPQRRQRRGALQSRASFRSATPSSTSSRST